MDENVQIVHDAIAAWNAHDPDRYAALLDDDCVIDVHGRPRILKSKDSARKRMQHWFNTFPDAHFEIKSAVPTTRGVLLSWTITATDRGGSTEGAPPLQSFVCSVVQFRNGRIVHAWHYFDRPAMLDCLE